MTSTGIPLEFAIYGQKTLLTIFLIYAGSSPGLRGGMPGEPAGAEGGVARLHWACSVWGARDMVSEADRSSSGVVQGAMCSRNQRKPV